VHTVDVETAEGRTAAPAGPAPAARPRRWRWWPSTRLERVTAALFAVALTVLLLPVLGAPINADERFQYFVAEAQTRGSFAGLFSWTWNEIPGQAAQGRITPLGFLAQRIEYFLGLRASVAFGIPLRAVHGVVRLLLLLLVLWAVRGFLRQVRARGPEGTPVGLAPERVGLVLATASLVFALGATVQDQFSNSMVTYPVLTYTAFAILLGFPAILLALLGRLAARPSRWRAGAGVVVAALLGAVLCVSYELYYVAFPTMVAAVALQHVASPGARRAKVLLLGGVTLGFGVTFAWTRWIVARACAEGACYVGVQPELGSGTARTAALNVLNSLAFAGWGAAREDLAANGLAGQYPSWPGNALSTVVVVATAAWAVLLLAYVRRWTPVVAGEARAVAKAMVVVAGAGLGAATVMALSAQAQVRINTIGEPYRNTFSTWGSIALGGTLTVLLVALVLRRRRHVAVPFAALAACAALLGVFQFPLNAAVSRSYDTSTSLPRRVADEVTYGERTAAADARRCALVREAAVTDLGRSAGRRLLPSAATAFESVHGLPFCSTGAGR
jgi:hypothetical protein